MARAGEQSRGRQRRQGVSDAGMPLWGQGPSSRAEPLALAWPAGAGRLLRRLAAVGLMATGWVMAGSLDQGAAAASRQARSGTPVVLADPALPGSRLVPLSFADLPGWAEDDLSAAFSTFRASCGALRQPPAEVGPASAPTLRAGLLQACAAAAALGVERPDGRVARLFFEANFRPFEVVPTRRPGGFFTGYYEPEVDGALSPGHGFDVPVYGRPDDLVMAGGPTANGGVALRRAGEQLVPYYDRAEIEDGALAGQGLEIVYLKDPIDLFFMQIQGSARVRLADGRVLRLNYDGYNGFPYTPVGRLLIARGLVPKDEMSMDRIRAFMEQHPEEGRLLRRENRAFVFFKALPLAADTGPMGAQGVPLTAGRSLAVDRRLHSYGTPVFVAADLPLSAPGQAEPFHRLMIAQDTGSAIVGPARADLYFGAGAEAGALAGRIRHGGRFILLAPRFAMVSGSPAPKAAP